MKFQSLLYSEETISPMRPTTSVFVLFCSTIVPLENGKDSISTLQLQVQTVQLTEIL